MGGRFADLHIAQGVCDANVSMKLLCGLYTCHKLLQFHVSSGFLCGRVCHFMVFAS